MQQGSAPRRSDASTEHQNKLWAKARAFIAGAGSRKRWFAAICLVLTALVGAVPGNFLTDVIKGWTSAGPPSSEASWSWLYAGACLLLSVLAAVFAFITLRQFGLFGVKVIGQNQVRKVEVMVITLSIPFPDTVAEPGSKLASLVEQVCTNPGDRDLETFASLTGRNASLPGDIGTYVSMLSWQQGWRILRDQLADDGPLRKIILLTSSHFFEGNGTKEFNQYFEVLRCLLEREGCTTADLNKTPPANAKRPIEVHRISIADDSLEVIQADFRQLVKQNTGMDIGIDITGGTRIYAFAAATAALADNCYMFYVTDAEDGFGATRELEPQVRCYDIRPELQSV